MWPRRTLDKVSRSLSPIPTGTVMCFFQAAAPTGWTQVTTQNDKALRVVSGAGGGAGGALALSAATVGNTTLTIAQMPSHTHTQFGGMVAGAATGGGVTDRAAEPTGSEGGGASHNHALALAFIDMILASKN